MEKNSSRVVIHTTMEPETPAPKAKRRFARIARASSKTRGARLAHSAQKLRRPRIRRARTTGEKLLTNTAIACALLLGVMAAGSLDAPWAKRVSSTVTNAVTMRMDLDETLGQLQFVRNILPDAALVFWNMDDARWASPVDGQLTHAYQASQPYLLFGTAGQKSVFAADAGTVSAVTENDRGEWTIMLEHENDTQTVYAYLGHARVQPGEQVARGAQIGLSKDENPASVYFEAREQGKPVDPGNRLSL